MGVNTKAMLRIALGVVIGSLAVFATLKHRQPESPYPTRAEIESMENNAAAPAHTLQRDVLLKTRRSTVRVFSSNEHGVVGAQTGTYFHVFERYFVLTTAHGILGDCDATKIFTEGGIVDCVSFAEVDRETDYAIIEIPKLADHIPMEVDRDIPRGASAWTSELGVMTRIFYTGYPNGMGPLTLSGYIAGYGAHDYILLNSYAWSGSSGAGVFSASGKYIGYVLAVDVGESHMGLPQVIEDIVVMVPAYKINWESAREIASQDTGPTGPELPESFDTSNYSIDF